MKEEHASSGSNSTRTQWIRRGYTDEEQLKQLSPSSAKGLETMKDRLGL